MGTGQTGANLTALLQEINVGLYVSKTKLIPPQFCQLRICTCPFNDISVLYFHNTSQEIQKLASYAAKSY